MSTKKLLVLDANGRVIDLQKGFDTSNYALSSYEGVRTVIVDEELSDAVVSYTTQTVSDTGNPDERTVTSTPVSISVNPFTEQVLTGTMFGKFELNEEIVQSTILPVIVNNYVVGGVTQSDFIPTVGSIGVSGGIGIRAAQFRGTYNDLSTQKAAGIRLPAFTTSASTPYFLMEGWLYFQTTPTGYDHIIMTRSADGVNNSTNDSFRLEYDTSSNQIQFHYSDSSYASAGYRGIVNVSPSGITLNQWNHFAVAWSTQGGSAAIKTYWNGTSLYSASGFTGHLRNSTAPLMVGSGASGDYPLKGWMEDVHIRMGGVTLALANYALLGSTAENPYEEDFSGDYTVYLLSMNGPEGSSLFPVGNLCRVSGTVSYHNSGVGILGASLVTREDSDITGLTLFDGVCGGFSVSGGSAANVFGVDSGACMVVTGVQQLHGLSMSQYIRRNAADYTNYYLMGVTVMYGQSGDSGDFPRLFSSGWTAYGTSFSFLPVQTNINYLRNIYDNIAVLGYTGNTSIEDYYGTLYTFGPTHAKKLYEDVIAYRASGETLRTTVISQINGASTDVSLRSLSGVSSSAVLKIAPTAKISGIGGIFISPKAKITKVTAIPESQYLPGKGSYIPIEDPELFGI
jgi:hypothetical protein